MDSPQPAAVEPRLLAWIGENYAAIRSEDQGRTRLVAKEFDDIIHTVLAGRRPDSAGTAEVTEQLLAVEVNGQPLNRADVVSVLRNWTAANRDELVFGDPDSFDPHANAPHNLVYGIGKHVCPGRALATIELRTLVRALLAGTQVLRLAPDMAPTREVAPVGGWARVPVILD